MIRRASVVARLKAQAPSLRLVEGLAQLAALKQNPPTNVQPAAYVVPVSETASDNRLANGVAQRNAVTFGVVLCVTDLSDPRGVDAGDALDRARGEIRAALVGWTPEGADGPALFLGGETVDLDRFGALWWMDRFRATESIRRIG
ncbi:hypothetical protein D3877_10370 [Azospirillum cavernae]|uniref:DUF3168 domain-containing protein n=1 Tax=Azospirillum cavernae TaxID=2320860 RepID=A0A418W4C9_9PROT|nr:hypothetical protein [Azospirillum cavernae]RJF84872.1 hypothetical protein D3877_10370 [Azospirillum cavernae]